MNLLYDIAGVSKQALHRIPPAKYVLFDGLRWL